MTTPPLSRRAALRDLVVVVVSAAAGYLVARNSDAAKGKTANAAANGYGYSAPQTARGLVALDQVPVGGGVVLTSPDVVITRSSSGDVHAFSSVCTHQGCTVSGVRDGEIQCPCHGSRFDAATGEVVAGPAPRPLPAVAVVVRDGEVFTA